MKDLLKKLTALGGVSGSENEAADFCIEYLSDYGKTFKDFNNNVITVFGNENSEKTILLDAHLDRIGFIITAIDEKGFLKVDKCGGVDLHTVLGSPVTVYGKEKLSGVVCCMPPHLSDGKEDESVSIDNVWIDTGLSAEIVKNTVSVGDSVILDSKFTELLNERVSCGGLDNRSGVAVLFRVCQLLKNEKLNYKVAVLLSCQEETYATGAITKAYEITPDEAICVDVSFANQPGVNDQYADIKLGYGPMVCFSSTLDKAMSDKMIQIANSKKIPVQYEVCGGRTGTNADHIGVSKNGIKTAVVSIPQKNMHTQVEIIDLKDLENTAQLIAGYIISGGVE